MQNEVYTSFCTFSAMKQKNRCKFSGFSRYDFQYEMEEQKQEEKIFFQPFTICSYSRFICSTEQPSTRWVAAMSAV